jgi:hypothetical protein
VRKVLNIIFFFSEFKGDKETVNEVILTLTALIVRNEFFQKVEEVRGITCIMDVFVSYPDSKVKGSIFYVYCKYEDTKIFRRVGIAQSVKWLATGCRRKV